MYACSPKWDNDWITEDDLSIILTQLSLHIEPAPYGPDSIGLSHGLHFTGGEPFLNFELLCTAVGIAESLNIPDDSAIEYRAGIAISKHSQWG